MGEYELSNEQKIVVDERHKNLLVSAAAGSGKTFVLVERIKRLILNNEASIKNMLIVTFTEAAASEMKERFSKAIRDELKSTNEKEIISRLNHELSLIQSANISTFHSFCMEVIKRFYYLIDIEPRLKVVSDVEENMLLTESLDELIEKYFKENNEEFLSFLDKYTDGKKIDFFKEMILGLYGKIMALSEPFSFLDKVIDNLDFDFNDLYNSDIYKEIEGRVLKGLDKSISTYEDAIMKLENMDNKVKQKSLYQSDLNVIKNIRENLIDHNLDAIINFDSKEFPRLTSKYLDSKEQDVIEETKSEIKGVRDKEKAFIHDIREKFFYDDINTVFQEIKETKNDSIFLVQSIKAFHNIYSDKKKEKELITFTDMEHFAFEILKYDEANSYYKEKFEHIFIDEYQDTNSIQDAIINKIKRDNNLFMVGDIKQSIYRFRNADPSIFNEKSLKFSKDIVNSLKVVLKDNYRSKREIISFVNLVFKNIMEGYTKENFLNGKYELLNEDFQDVKLFLVDLNTKGGSKEESSEESITSIDYSKIEKEALLTVNLIKDLKDKGYEYGDIKVLLRSVKTHGDIFYTVLNQNGIPTYIDDNKGYFDTIEISTICSLLRVIDNEDRDIDLATIMRSDIFRFSELELAEIRINDLSDDSFYKATKKYMEEGENIEIRTKLLHMYELIKKYRKETFIYPLEELIFNIMLETGFYEIAGCMTSGTRRQGNLRTLVEKAMAYRINYGGMLYGFLEYIDEIRKKEIETSQVKMSSSGDDCVTIMTIHKSKGLEFPVVILPGYNDKINYRDNISDLAYNKDLGFSLSYVNSELNYKRRTAYKNIISMLNKDEEVSEAKRLLYVAFTRAKDVLYLIGSVDDFDNEKEKFKKGEENDLTYLNMTGKYITDYMKRVNEHDLSDIKVMSEAERKEILRILDDVDIDITDEFSKTMSFKRESSLFKTKQSVTELNKEGLMEYSFNFPTTNSEELTQAEIGTILHKVLRYIDFTLVKEKGKKYIDFLLDKMINEEIILPYEKELVNYDSIINLVNSHLGERLINSISIHREQPFTLEIVDGSLVQGVIDCYFYEDDYIVLIDYKNTRIKDEDKIKEMYKTQINLYREALEKATGKIVKEAYLYLTLQNKLIEM